MPKLDATKTMGETLTEKKAVDSVKGWVNVNTIYKRSLLVNVSQKPPPKI